MIDEEIPLPPLPLPSRRNGTYDSAAFRFYTEEQMRVYARAAVLLDRQQRAAPGAEPVAWIESPHGAIRANPLYRLDPPPQSLAWRIPLYAAPPAPSAEPPPAAPTGEEEVTRLVRWLTAPSGKGAK